MEPRENQGVRMILGRALCWLLPVIKEFADLPERDRYYVMLGAFFLIVVFIFFAYVIAYWDERRLNDKMSRNANDKDGKQKRN